MAVGEGRLGAGARAVLRQLVASAPTDERRAAADRLLQATGEARAAVDLHEATRGGPAQTGVGEAGSSEDLLRRRDLTRDAVAALRACLTDLRPS